MAAPTKVRVRFVTESARKEAAKRTQPIHSSIVADADTPTMNPEWVAP